MIQQIVVDTLIILSAAISEPLLLYVNYVARVRYGFNEMNPRWKWFDQRGKNYTIVSLGLHAIIFTSACIAALVLGGYALLGFLAGASAMNTMLDYHGLSRVRKSPQDWSRCPRCNHFNIGRVGGMCNGCEKLYNRETQRSYGGFRPV